MNIDLNADLGEGMDDAALLPWLTSANVACALHAGDPSVMDETVIQALARGIRIGAHPGYADRENFGRVALTLTPKAIEDWVAYQVFALDGFVRTRGGVLAHVKPHGALYHRGSEDLASARAIAAAVRRVRSDLILVGQAGSLLVKAGREAGLPTAEEAFADRRYLPNGKLTPRSQPGALLTDPDEAAAQAVRIARDHRVSTADSSTIQVRADTLCLHGDTPGAPNIAEAVKRALQAAGVDVVPISPTMLY